MQNIKSGFGMISENLLINNILISVKMNSIKYSMYY